MTRPPRAAAAAAATALAVAGAGLAAVTVGATSTAHAAKGGTCSPFTVSTGGTTYTGEQRRTIPADSVGETIDVRGKYVRFTIRSASLAVADYTLTGRNSPRPDKDLPLDAPTVVFESKVPLHGAVLTSGVELRMEEDGIVVERHGGGQDMKIQAKNCAQGGVFQMEPEPGTRYRHQLGADFRYNRESRLEDDRLCITNGSFSAYESPELATKLSPDDGLGRTSTWRVSSGGRMGFVVGEDAVEGGCRP